MAAPTSVAARTASFTNAGGWKVISAAPGSLMAGDQPGWAIERNSVWKQKSRKNNYHYQNCREPTLVKACRGIPPPAPATPDGRLASRAHTPRRGAPPPLPNASQRSPHRADPRTQINPRISADFSYRTKPTQDLRCTLPGRRRSSLRLPEYRNRVECGLGRN
ncbi:hypothetical protein D3C78_1226130 [compost metagenome]